MPAAASAEARLGAHMLMYTAGWLLELRKASSSGDKRPGGGSISTGPTICAAAPWSEELAVPQQLLQDLRTWMRGGRGRGGLSALQSLVTSTAATSSFRVRISGMSSPVSAKNLHSKAACIVTRAGALQEHCAGLHLNLGAANPGKMTSMQSRSMPQDFSRPQKP